MGADGTPERAVRIGGPAARPCYQRGMKHVALAVVLAAFFALPGCLVKKSTHQKALNHIAELESRVRPV